MCPFSSICAGSGVLLHKLILVFTDEVDDVRSHLKSKPGIAFVAVSGDPAVFCCQSLTMPGKVPDVPFPIDLFEVEILDLPNNSEQHGSEALARTTCSKMVTGSLFAQKKLFMEQPCEFRRRS